MTPRMLDFTVPGAPGAHVTVTEADGSLVFVVRIAPGAQGEVGDLRGVFFQVADEGLLPRLMVSGADVTDRQFKAEAVTDLGQGANMKGSGTARFDAGIEIGTAGLGRGDDIRTTTFTLSAAGAPLTLDLVRNVEFGIRIASAGSAGHRADTVKLTGTSPSVICFYPGTRIATPAGEVAVEALRIGDLVLTAEGEAAPVRWMGRQTVATRFADPLRVLPIRIMAGALGDNLPGRDLLVSPDHALLVEGILVHAAALVNGRSILREAEVPRLFTYHHVELADHALVLAEGVPAESFVDNAERLGFDNWAEHEALCGHLPPVAEMDRPRAKSHRQVPMRTRRHLDARAAALHLPDAAAA